MGFAGVFELEGVELGVKGRRDLVLESERSRSRGGNEKERVVWGLGLRYLLCK